MALAVPLSRFTSRVGGGSAFFVRQHYAFMSYIADTLLFLLGIALYSSGLLLWPIRRWLCRRQKVRGRALWFVFLIQAAALPVFIFMGTFYSSRLDVGYGWALLWIEFNVLFTIIGIFAWIRDRRYEREMEVSHAA